MLERSTWPHPGLQIAQLGQTLKKEEIDRRTERRTDKPTGAAESAVIHAQVDLHTRTQFYSFSVFTAQASVQLQEEDSLG